MVLAIVLAGRDHINVDASRLGRLVEEAEGRVAGGCRNLLVFENRDLVTGRRHAVVGEKNRVLMPGEQRAVGGNQRRAAGCSGHLDERVVRGRQRSIRSNGSLADVVSNQRTFHLNIHSRGNVGCIDRPHQAGLGVAGHLLAG
jgi:hypothetical protein